jgi:hypothetical protein
MQATKCSRSCSDHAVSAPAAVSVRPALPPRRRPAPARSVARMAVTIALLQADWRVKTRNVAAGGRRGRLDEHRVCASRRFGADEMAGTDRLTILGFVARFAFALLVVGTSYNPTGYSYYAAAKVTGGEWHPRSYSSVVLRIGGASACASLCAQPVFQSRPRFRQ